MRCSVGIVVVAMRSVSLPTAVDAILTRFGSDMRPGDAYILNDAYEGGMHLPNVLILAPCFTDEGLLAYACTIVHHTDIGGHVPGSVPVNSREPSLARVSS